uniref:Uncharacterized protein n=1 Tax=Ectopseudomonas oleovorans TaxID=301 RepID=A0A653BB59_ECTOL
MRSSSVALLSPMKSACARPGSVRLAPSVARATARARGVLLIIVVSSLLLAGGHSVTDPLRRHEIKHFGYSATVRL